MTSWPTKKLGEVAEVIMGQSPPSSSYNERGEGLPFFQGKAEFGEIYPIPLKFCSSPSRIAETNDILISVRAPVGNINIAREKSCIGRGLGALRAKKNILNQMFLFYFMKKNENDWSRLSTGSTFSAIKGSSLRNFGVPTPPLQIQKQIVERLDKIAEAQKLNDDLIQKSDELFQSLLHKELNPAGPADAKAMAGKKNWEVRNIGEVCKVIGGGTPSREEIKHFKGDIPWVTVKDLHVLEIKDALEHINKEALKNSAANLVPADTVLVATRVGLGKVAIARRPLTFNQDIKGLRANDGVDANYLFYAILKNAGKIEKNGKGATVKGITQKFLKSIKIPLPSLETQKQIVEKLSAVQEYKTQLLAQKSKLKELFNSVLHKSMQE